MRKVRTAVVNGEVSWVVEREDFEEMCEQEEMRRADALRAAQKLLQMGQRFPLSVVPKMSKAEALQKKIDPNTRGVFTDSQLIVAHAGKVA